MIWGISSFTYGWNIGIDHHLPAKTMSVLDLVGKTLEFELRCLQIGDNLPLHLLPESLLQTLKQQINQHLIRLEIGARGLTPGHLDTFLKLAAFLEAPLVRFVIDSVGYEPDDKEVEAIIKGFLPQLHQQNCTLGIENHDRFKARDLARIMRNIDDEKVGICLDCANSLGAGEGLEWVTKQLAPYTVNLHIKDFTIERFSHKMGFLIEGCPAGKGMMDLAWMQKELARYGRCQSAVLELWTPPENTLDATAQKEKKWAEESVAYLKKYFTEL